MKFVSWPFPSSSGNEHPFKIDMGVLRGFLFHHHAFRKHTISRWDLGEDENPSRVLSGNGNPAKTPGGLPLTTNILPGFLPRYHCLGKIPGDPAGKGKSCQDSRRDSPPRLFLVRIPAGFLPGNLFPAGIPSRCGNLAGIPPGKENLAGILAGMPFSLQDPGRSRRERKIPPGFPPRFPSGTISCRDPGGIFAGKFISRWDPAGKRESCRDPAGILVVILQYHQFH